MTSTTVASNTTLTFSDSNTTVTIGDNVTITLTGSNDIVNGGNNDVIIDGGNGNTITVGTHGSLTINGSNDHDVAGASSTGVVNGMSDGIIVGSNSTVTLNGSNNASNAGVGSVTIVNGSNNGAVVTAGILTITGTSDLAQVLNGSTATIASSASGAVVWSPDLATANTVTDNGTQDSVTLGNGSLLTINGIADTGSIGANATAYVNGANDTLTEGTGSYSALQGNHDVGTANGTGFFNLAGNGQTATVAAGGYIGVVSGSNQVANVNGGTVTTLNNVQVTIVGSGNHVNGGANSIYAVNGNANIVIESTGSFTSLNGSNDTGTATGTGGFNLNGANDTVTVGSGAYVGVITGSIGAIVNDNGGTVVTNDNVSVTVNGSGTTVNGAANSNYTVLGSNDTVSVSFGSTGFIAGSNDTLNETGAGDTFNVANTGAGTDIINLSGASGDYVGLLGGSGYSVNGSNAAIATWDDTHFNVFGNNDSINTDCAVDGTSTSGSSGAVTGTNDTLVEGAADSFSVINTGTGINTVGENGANDVVNVQDQVTGGGTNVRLNSSKGYAGLLGGAGYNVTGSNGQIATWANTGFNVTGDGNYIGTAANSYGSVTGTNDTLVENAGNSFSVINTGTGTNTVAENGANDVVNAQDQVAGGGTNVQLNSSNGYAGLLGGGGYTVTGSDGIINTWDSTALSVVGNQDTISIGKSSSAVISGTGDTVNVDGALSGFLVTNTGPGTNTVNENGDGDSGNVQNVAGGTTNANFSATGDYVGLLGGTNYNVTGIGGRIATWVNTDFNVAGYNDTINTAQGDTAAVIGGGNTITAGPDVAVIVAGTGTDTDLIVASGAGAGDLTASGLSAGITLLGGGQANVIGGNNTVFVGDGADLGLFGSGNAVVAGTNATVAISGNYNQYASVANGTVTFQGVNNSAAVNGTSVYSADGNPITVTGLSSTAGNVISPLTQAALQGNQIDEVYLEVLGRSVDPQGLAQSQAMLVAGSSLDTIRRTLATSTEATNDFKTTLSSVGAAPPTSDQVVGFENVLSAAYDAPIQVITHDGKTVLADTSVTNLLAELPVLETLDNGRTLKLGLAGGDTVSFANTAQLADFLYGVALQKSQADTFITNTLNQDIHWLNLVDQPMLEVSQQFEDLAAYNTSIGNAGQATISNAAARIALQIAGEAPGSRADLREKVTVNGHQTVVTVFGSATDTSDATFHDIDPGIGGILESVGVAILNIAAAAFPQSGLPYVAAVVDAGVAAQDFSNGQILAGILQLAEAAGSFEIGQGAVNGVAGATQTGRVILTATQAVGGVYGAVQSAQSGDALGVLASALEATAAVASGIGQYSQDSSTVTFANQIKNGLNIASTSLTTADAFQQGNLAAGLISSLGFILSNVADDYVNNQASITSAIDQTPISPITNGTPAHIAFVGGFFDQTVSDNTNSGLVKTYETNYAAANPGADVKYFTFDDSAGLTAWIKSTSGDAVVIGHSYGADTAASVVAAGANVKQLVTLDPVSYFRLDYSAVAAHAGQWTDYNAAGAGLTFPNAVAGLGSDWGTSPQGFATTFANIPADHATIASRPVFNSLLGVKL